MAWYADGSMYTYIRRASPTLVCAGWLAGGQPFRTGTAPAAFVDQLAWRCLNGHDRPTFGIHHCELCSPEAAGNILILHEGETHLLGTAEITVKARERTYAAPTLVVHYVLEHGYLPPDDLVEAIMEDLANPRLENWSLVREPWLR